MVDKTTRTECPKEKIEWITLFSMGTASFNINILKSQQHETVLWLEAKSKNNFILIDAEKQELTKFEKNRIGLTTCNKEIMNF